MSYGYVYVAQISMGADFNQCVKANRRGRGISGTVPDQSLMLRVSTMVSRKGMAKAQTEEELAVKAGYWHCFRFNPALAAEGKDAFSLDSKEPTGEYQEVPGRRGALQFSETCKSGKSCKTPLRRNESEAKARYSYLNS